MYIINKYLHHGNSLHNRHYKHTEKTKRTCASVLDVHIQICDNHKLLIMGTVNIFLID